MKYVIIIPDGAADHPLDELEGKTPFEAATKPHTDRLSTDGRQGTVATTPHGFSCGSDVCTMSLLGYDPARYHTGRAPLEAAALGIELADTDWVFRVNVVTVIDGLMQDHSAGHISSEEGQLLINNFAARVNLPAMTLYPGVSYRNIMVDASNSGTGKGRDWSKLTTTPPHDILGLPIRKHMPRGGHHVALLEQIITESEAVFTNHEVNQTRHELGEPPATHLWPWGQGRKPQMPSFESRFGLRGAMITAVDLLAGLARFIGWDRLNVPGQSSYHDDTDYTAAGRHAIDAIDRYDLVCVHIESPDEASHTADVGTKVQAIEAIDRHVVGPIHESLLARGEDYRFLILPDHYTSVASRLHDPTPVPFVIYGKHINGVLMRPFSELNAGQSDLHIQNGHELMEYFLFGGLS